MSFQDVNLAAPCTSASDAIEWDIHNIERKYDAYRFAKLFENRFCVYSPTVQKLYTDYQIVEPSLESDKIMLLPTLTADSEPYHDIEPSCIVSTDVKVIPGEIVGRKGIHLAMPDLEQPGKFKVFAFKEGLAELKKSLYQGRPFLPVLMNGDLREFDKKLPFLQLHIINIDKLVNLSSFERNDMSNLINTRLNSMIAA
jgi:hypothetical protein